MRARSGDSSPVVRLGSRDVPRVVDVLVEAFHDYPVMRFVIGAADDYLTRLRKLIHFFVSVRALRGEPLLGVAAGETLVAAATVSFPSDVKSPPEVDRAREAVWTDLGASARARYERCGEVWKTLDVAVPHIHLNMIGVRPSSQGKGHAWRLLEQVHEMSRRTVDSEGVTLTTEDPANVAYYERAGYEVTGRARIAPELETWAFFRRTADE